MLVTCSCRQEENSRSCVTRTLPKVKTEMSLHVLAYNMKRVMKILTPEGLIDCLQP